MTSYSGSHMIYNKLMQETILYEVTIFDLQFSALLTQFITKHLCRTKKQICTHDDSCVCNNKTLKLLITITLET